MRTSKTLFTPAEVSRLTHSFGEIDDGYTASDVYNYYFQEHYDGRDRKWHSFCALAAVYNAGRLQGVREERQRRKARRA